MDEYEKVSPPTRDKPRTVQPVAILYTNCAIPDANTYTYRYTLKFRLYLTEKTARFY